MPSNSGTLLPWGSASISALNAKGKLAKGTSVHLYLCPYPGLSFSKGAIYVHA